jgi:hypothetical protein
VKIGKAELRNFYSSQDIISVEMMEYEMGENSA